MKKFTRILVAVLAVAMLSMSFAGCGLVEDTEVVERVKILKETVLTVADDIEVNGAYYGWFYSDEYNTAYAEAQQAAEAEAAADSAADSAASSAATSDAAEADSAAQAPVEVDVDIEAVKKSTQDRIASTKMLRKKAEDAGIKLTSVDYANISDQVEQYRTQLTAGLSQQGMGISFNDYLSFMSTNADAVNEIFEDQYYGSLYLADLVKDDYVTAKHILVKYDDEVHTKEEAQTIINDIKKQLDEGADFDKLMKEKSEDTGADGSVNSPEGYTFAQDGSMVPEFEAAAFALAENAISDIVAVESAGYKGFHILKKVPTSLSGIAPVLTSNEKIDAERDNAAKDVKVELKDKISYFDSLYK